jgi:hypothetical protein
VVVDLRRGQHLPELLQCFRKQGIWTSSVLAPSEVGLVAFTVHEASPAAGLQLALASALEESDSVQLGNLIDGLRSERRRPFLWMREVNQDPMETHREAESDEFD